MRPRCKLKLFAVRLYSRIWLPAAVLLTCLTVYNFTMTFRREFVWGSRYIFPLIWEIVVRGTQILEFWFGGVNFAKFHYRFLSICATAPVVINALAVVELMYFWRSDIPWHGPTPGDPMVVYIVFHALINITEVSLWDDFRQYKQTEMVLECMDYLISADSIALTQSSEAGRTSTWFNVLSRLQLQRRSTGPIALLDDQIEFDSIRDSSPTSSPPLAAPEFTDGVLHWLTAGLDLPLKKQLWITVDRSEGLEGIPQAVSEITSACDEGTTVAFVDVSNTHSVFWPLVRGLAAAYQRYSEQLIWHIPKEMAYHFRGSEMVRRLLFGPQRNFSLSPWLYYDDYSELVAKLIGNVLDAAHYEHRAAVRLGVDRFQPPPRILLIIHGLRSQEQADEVYGTIKALRSARKQHCDYIRIVVISGLQLWRHVSCNHSPIMEYVCSLSVSEDGFVRYSGTNPDLPTFDEHLFLLLVEGIHRTGGVEADVMWNKLPPVAHILEADPIDTSVNSNFNIFATLHRASQIRKQILKLLATTTVISRSQIDAQLAVGNRKISQLIQHLFESDSYQDDLIKLPRDHVLVVLNLTHSILDHEFSDLGQLEDTKRFLRRAHGFLNWLATYLKVLPDDISVTGVTLLSEYPVNNGGFSNIYRGIYISAEGKPAEVALKVLRIFQDQSDAAMLRLQDKFITEALLWYYLRHDNIVPFIGVDSSSFASPRRAMVSPWMPLGSVLKYIGNNSPSSLYATELLCDVVEGLSYLHRHNIVHGDLCGRNILVDQTGSARLADFGLTELVESDTLMKSVSSIGRAGTTRFMAPELLFTTDDTQLTRAPASDIWAFGCVCCEIWSEGEAPYSHIVDEGVLIRILSKSTQAILPYPDRPVDKSGNPMPGELWKLAQCCWSNEPSERPTLDDIADVLFDVKNSTKSPLKEIYR